MKFKYVNPRADQRRRFNAREAMIELGEMTYSTEKGVLYNLELYNRIKNAGLNETLINKWGTKHLIRIK